MGRKTVAELEAENKELQVRLQNEVAPADVVAENNALRAQLVETKEAKAESEARMMKEIEAMGEQEMVVANGVIVGTAIQVLTPDEYRDYSKAQGRIMGRLPNQKTVCSIEELRSLINSNWSPSMIQEKHGMDNEELKQLVWKLSLRELRDRPIKLDFTRDQFGKEG